MFTFDEIPDIQYNTCEEVKYERKAYRQERGVDKEEPDLGDRNIKTFAKIGAYAKRVPFKKSEYSL
jgi:hypothetical protein